ncbi:MAG: aminotransferase class V-fold PLP-dependent enzyme [Candidatus Aegiribacteria sp.]|nr:aminotransferase class V-fold PLP-dependent enzyme [Candidatus Aegiribacteria sp.]
MKVYLDNNATTRMAPEVLDAMIPFLNDQYGNPSSFHTFGSVLMEHIEIARQQVADLIGAFPSEIIFTSGGTESDNTALFYGIGADSEKPGLVTSVVEHPAVLETAGYLEQAGHPLGLVKAKSNGYVNMNSLEELMTPNTGLVSIMKANNETGVIMPIREAAEIAHRAGALFHTDAVQAVGKIPVDVKVEGIDLLSLSAHKFHGPKGVGALYIRKGLKLNPFMHGGHQESGMRSGTYNIAGIVGLGKAAEMARYFIAEEALKTSYLLEKLESGILKECTGAVIVGASAERLPNTTTVLFTGVESEAVLTLIDLAGICVSSGSACSTGSKDPSYVLTSMGISANDANTAIRFSLSMYTSDQEIDYVLEVLSPIIEKLRKISPYAQ